MHMYSRPFVTTTLYPGRVTSEIPIVAATAQFSGRSAVGSAVLYEMSDLTSPSARFATHHGQAASCRRVRRLASPPTAKLLFPPASPAEPPSNLQSKLAGLSNGTVQELRGCAFD
ncbi:hypothetical protein LMH87_012280 [Akanthomyces muscarius]|uniref:Uncharacterized protein n=1 Tax=Akanthomyces muscarius TaxID=2231603 RepID=A0A9W8QDD8_AKAMU|nr:hypothetical protein LMH87_012280 [Akanthomyces muscarius]KAJ4151590.1 hypothetical protein LMH87_012280 [Akanthomyces muscarius]